MLPQALLNLRPDSAVMPHIAGQRVLFHLRQSASVMSGFLATNRCKMIKKKRRAGAILVSEATLKACSEDPDACEVGEIIARSIATGDNALVIATERDAELEALPFSFFKKAIYSRCALES